MHHSRNAHGRDGSNRPPRPPHGPAQRLRLVVDDEPALPFPASNTRPEPAPGIDFPRLGVPDEVIADVEHHLDRTQSKLDELRAMLDPFPGRDDDDFPPRAA